MATRIRTLESNATAGLALGPNWIVTLSDDALATSLISAGRAVAVTDVTTALTLFGTDRWEAHKFGTGAV
jgi:hypothetical protein